MVYLGPEVTVNYTYGSEKGIINVNGEALIKNQGTDINQATADGELACLYVCPINR